MGRPKGSKNKPREEKLVETLVLAADMPGTQVAAVATEILKEIRPDFKTILLTDEDLEPARKMKAEHARRAARFIKDEIASEMRRKEIGEVEELSVPQVVPFDLSGAFTRIAQQKARAAGYLYAQALRKTREGWVFEATNVPKVKNAPAAELQP